MPEYNLKPRPNLALIVYDAYPDSDLLPIDPKTDCHNIEMLYDRVLKGNVGDTLFQFLVQEIVEGGESELDGAILVIERARADVDAVLAALIKEQQKV